MLLYSHPWINENPAYRFELVTQTRAPEPLNTKINIWMFLLCHCFLKYYQTLQYVCFYFLPREDFILPEVIAHCELKSMRIASRNPFYFCNVNETGYSRKQMQGEIWLDSEKRTLHIRMQPEWTSMCLSLGKQTSRNRYERKWNAFGFDLVV